jgi:hypothetical protein
VELLEVSVTSLLFLYDDMAEPLTLGLESIDICRQLPFEELNLDPFFYLLRSSSSSYCYSACKRSSSRNFAEIISVFLVVFVFLFNRSKKLRVLCKWKATSSLAYFSIYLFIGILEFK